ncbi:protein of unknown function [Methylorubrum extorquens]|uniref:NADP-dependent oxidoreductase domain-containing protein n=1 Tax=Methylorubrum extorquens TaxID=408 RepID=A0A2N9ALP9_METEX|nr:protein of unknown function [Methylorubrum extorquens]
MPPVPPLSRRTLLQGAALTAGAGFAPALLRPARAADALITRPIPSSGERLPAMGIGTSRRYEVAATPEATAPLREAVERFVALGGRVIDTAPSYGTAEDVLGLILEGLREKNLSRHQGRGPRPGGGAGRDRALVPAPAHGQDRSHRRAQPRRHGSEPRGPARSQGEGPHPLCRRHGLARRAVPRA